MLIKGSQLTSHQREQVKAAFIYRWTKENPMRKIVYATIGKPRIPLQSDEEWLADHAFYFLQDGSRLMDNRNYCQPEWWVE